LAASSPPPTRTIDPTLGAKLEAAVARYREHNDRVEAAQLREASDGRR
jgi:hypothetical protein